MKDPEEAATCVEILSSPEGDRVVKVKNLHGSLPLRSFANNSISPLFIVLKIYEGGFKCSSTARKNDTALDHPWESLQRPTASIFLALGLLCGVSASKEFGNTVV